MSKETSDNDLDFTIYFYKQKPGLEALIVRIGSLDDIEGLEKSGTESVLENAGVSFKTFVGLLNHKFNINDSETITIRKESGEPIEDIELEVLETTEGTAEVSKCTLYSTVLDPTGRARVMVHMPGEKIRGFDAIYILEGEATLFFPRFVVEENGNLITSDEGQHIDLHPGYVAIIPALTPNGWSAIGNKDSNETQALKFLYMAMPPYADKTVKEASYRS